MVGDVGGWGGFGGIWVGGRQIRLGDRLVRGLSFKPWIRPYQSSTNLEQTLKKDLLFHSWLDQGVKTSFSLALEISYKPLLGSYMISSPYPPRLHEETAMSRKKCQLKIDIYIYIHIIVN